MANLAATNLTGPLERDIQKVHPATFQLFFLPPLSKHFLCARRIGEINPEGLGNVPSAVPG